MSRGRPFLRSRHHRPDVIDDSFFLRFLDCAGTPFGVMLLSGLGRVFSAALTSFSKRCCASCSLYESLDLAMLLGSSPVSTEDFFTWVGKCITSWAGVEDHLFEICVQSLGATKQRTAIVYYRTPTIDARLKLTDELVRTVLPRREKEDGGHDHADVKIWESLRKKIVDLLPIRNRLAHHPVTNKKIVPEPTGDDAVSIAVSRLTTLSWYESYVSDAERLRGGHEKAKPLMAPDLSNHRIAVEMIINELEIFRTHVLSKHIQ
jgi:hypothetical protein